MQKDEHRYIDLKKPHSVMSMGKDLVYFLNIIYAGTKLKA